MAISITLSTVGGDEGTWGTKTNLALTTIVDAINGTSGTLAPDLTEGSWKIGGAAVAPSAADLNVIDGLAASNVSLTEIGYLNNVTSNIQTQLNSKLSALTGAGSTIDTEDLTANRVVTSNSSGKIAVSNVTTTELNKLDGGTTRVQVTWADADGIVMNDNGTMTQATAQSLKQYMAIPGAITDLGISDGSNGQFLKTNGSGTFSFATVSAPTVSNATITLSAGNDLSGGGTITLNQSSNETVTFSHGNTSNLNGATSNSGSNYIQNITVDDNGHVTAITATDAASNISVSGGFNSAGSLTGASVRSSTQVSFSGGISVPNGKTIFGWGSDQSNMGLAWRSNWQGSVNSLTNYGNPFTNSTGGTVTVYGWVNTSGSATRTAVYMMFG